MHNYLYDNIQDYGSLPHKYWCDLLSTMEKKDNRKRAATQIKRVAASKAAPANYDSNAYKRFPLKKKARTVVILDQKNQVKNSSKNIGSQIYCVLYKKDRIIEHNWKSHSSKNCFGKFSDQAYVKEGLGGTLGNRVAAFKQNHKSENKWK